MLESAEKKVISGMLFRISVMQLKEKPTDGVASSLNFESFPENYFCIKDLQSTQFLFARQNPSVKWVLNSINKRRFSENHP